MQTEPFQSSNARWSVFVFGVVLLSYVVWGFRRGMFHSRGLFDVLVGYPANISRTENPWRYWLVTTLYLLFSIGFIASAILNIQHAHSSWHDTLHKPSN